MKNDKVFLIVFSGFVLSFLFCMFYFLYSVANDKNKREEVENRGKAILVETNSIGCAKYRYKGDEFWKCPKTLNIQQIEETHNRYSRKTVTTEQVPVVSD